MLTITKRFHFCASHRLFNPILSNEENKRIFQQCNQLHGHNFMMDITVSGPIDPTTGMIMNFHELKQIVGTYVISYFDHKNFETDIPEFKGNVQTVENLIRIIVDKLCGKWPKGIDLISLKIFETTDNWAEYSV